MTDGPRELPWGELMQLHVVKHLAKILARRWNLGLGFAAAPGASSETTVKPPRQGGSICAVLQSRPAGQGACAQTAAKISALFAEQHRRGELERAALAYTCHAGLTELAVPIVIEGEYLGCLLAGGLVVDGEALVEVDRRVGPHALPADVYREARGVCAQLSRAELGFLCELMELCAEELVAFQSELLAKDRRLRTLEHELTTRYRYDAIIGRSAPMQELYRVLDKVIDSDSTVLIQGGNGTGKELVAKAIHYNSARKGRRFVVQNCSAFNDNLLDSELFGHRRGAFTGAIADKQGLFEVADGGTFFLDEVGDMSPSLQVKLLRVLQEGTFIPVGDTSARKVDVRIIAATNRDLRRMVDEGTFREDLYYRLNVINLMLPALRERKDDVPTLVEYFLRKHAKGRRVRRLSKGCLARLMAYGWPGNIRELENEMERLVVLAGDEKLIGEELLSPRIRQQAAGELGATPGALPDAVATLERSMIFESLRKHGGNKSRAAVDLGISRRNLIRLVQKYDLDAALARK